MADLAGATIARKSGADRILQFSIFADNKVGRLNEIIGILANADVHVLAFTTLDTTDSTIVRLIPNYPEVARKLLQDNHYTFNEAEMVAVEIPSVDYIHRVTCALVQAEINIHYIYPFVTRPHGKSALAIRLEDEELARDILSRHQIKVLCLSDLAR